MLNDLHVFDTATMSWSQPKFPSLPPPAPPQGKEPSTTLHSLPFPVPIPRAGHTCTLVAPNKVLIFGGGDGVKILNDSWYLDTIAFTFTKTNIGGQPPASRCAHTATLLENKLIIFGGGDGSRRFKDLYLLDVELLLKNEEQLLQKAKRASLKLSKPLKDKKMEFETEIGGLVFLERN
jgi:hypothetical protein